MIIYINGLTEFKFYVRSYAESSYDYVVVSNLDCNLSSGTTSGTNVKLTTSSKQNSGTTIGSYQLVEFTNIDGGQHFITVMYRKDSGVNSGTDQGYVLIPKIAEPAPAAHSYLTVTYQPLETSADTVFYSSNFDATQLVSMEIDGVNNPLFPTSKRFTSTGTTCTVRYGFHENLTNCAHLFEDAKCITYVDATEWDTSKVTDMSYMFANNTATTVQSMTISAGLWNVSKVTNMSHMFYGKTILNTDFSAWANQVTAVTDTSHMFANATPTTSSSVDYTFGAWDLRSIEDMSYMFLEFSSKSTDLKTWNVSNAKNMEGMFKGSISCKTEVLDLSGWDTRKVTNMSYMFYGLKYLKTITGLDTWNTSGVTNMSYMFSDNKALTTFNVTNWNTQNVKNMAYMFQGLVSATTSVDLTNWNTSNVEDMNHMFSSSTKLTSIGTINNWNVAKVKDMSYLLAAVPQLASQIDISNWETSSVENIEFLFSRLNYTDLSFVIDKWDLSKVTKIAGLFNGCTGLTNVGSFATKFASKYDTTKLQSLRSLFSECSKLTSVGDFSLWSTPLVTDYSYMFNNCSGLTSIGSIQNLTLSPSGNYTPVTNIEFMLNNCKNLDDVGHIGNWDGSQNTKAAYAFANCYKFTNLGKFTNWHTSGTLTSIAHMFENCPAVSNHLLGDLTNWKTSAVTDMSYFICCNVDLALEDGVAYNAEYNCHGIGDIGQWDTRNVTNMAYMLAGHTGFNNKTTFEAGDPPLISTFANWNTAKVTNMAGLFMSDMLLFTPATGEPELASNGIPALFNSLSAWTTSAVTDMSYMFYATLYHAPSASTSYFDVFKNWNVKKVTNMAYMFKGCHGMNFKQPFYHWTSQLSGVTSMHGMFMNMSPMEDNENTNEINITLTNFANKTTDLGSLCEGREALTSATVILGKGTTADTQVTNIADMFTGCKNLTSIKMDIPINADNAKTITGVASSGTFYYPSGKQSLYAAIRPGGWTMVQMS